MSLFNGPKEINQGDSVFMEYDGKKAYGVVVSIQNELIEVDYTTELSKEKKVDKFLDGIWKKNN